MTGIKIDGADALTNLNIKFHPTSSPRLDIWRWLYLYKYKKLNLDPDNCNGSLMRDSIASALIRNKALEEELLTEEDKFILPAGSLGWITDDQRQILWLKDRIDDLTDDVLPAKLTRLKGRDRLIAALDLWDRSIDRKDEEIGKLRSKWNRQRVTDSELDWFADKKEGKERCICARDWLMNSHLRHQARKNPISKYTDLTLFFETAGLSSFERSAAIKEIKNRWSRLRFYERNTDKKQVNVLLPEATIAELDKLAKRHNLKRAQLIETLVINEAKSGIYLSPDNQ